MSTLNTRIFTLHFLLQTLREMELSEAIMLQTQLSSVFTYDSLIQCTHDIPPV